jgi:hypothetical protein
MVKNFDSHHFGCKSAQRRFGPVPASQDLGIVACGRRLVLLLVGSKYRSVWLFTNFVISTISITQMTSGMR